MDNHQPERGSSLRYLGHAGFIFEHGGLSILMDPWFFASKLKAAYPYPDNSFLLDEVHSKRYDYLYISHAHTDHYDIEFLSEIDRKTVVLCPDFKSRELEWLLEDAGFENIIRMGHLQPHALNDQVTAAIILDGTAAEDSGILVEAAGFRFLNLNDCQPRLSDLPKADLLTCQFSGAIHYPQTYDMYDDAQKAVRVETAVRTYVDIFERKLKAVSPRYFIPSAGPFCFLHPSQMQYNPQPGIPSVFVGWEDFAPRTAAFYNPADTLRLFPSDIVRIDPSGRCDVEERFSDLTPYPDDTFETYAARRVHETAPLNITPAPKGVSTEELADHWSGVQRLNKRLLEFRGFFKKFVIEAYEHNGTFLHRWFIHIGAGGPHVYDAPPADFVASYTFKMPMQMLRFVIDGEQNWDDMISSHFMRLSRDPDVFDAQFFALLRYHHAPARGRQFVIAGESNEMIPLDGSPGTLVQRYCPHAGEDLIGVKACDGVVVCPRHLWKWDLKTGTCLYGGNVPLKVQHTVPGATT